MYLNDEPIKNLEDDLLNREEFVSRLHHTIINWVSNESLVIGLYGPWGSGKSSVLNLLEKKIDSTTNKNTCIVVKFDPWFFNSAEQLLISFFSTIQNAIIKLSGKEKLMIRDYFSKYAKMLSFSFSPEISVGPVKFSLPLKKGEKEETPNKVRSEIVKIIKVINGRIIVMIDNLDRLEPNELMLMLKLVRLCNDFPNFIYVLAFDQNQVIKILNNQKDINPEYLKKIIQVDITMPAVDQNQVDNFVYSGINSIADSYKLNFDQGVGERFVSVYQKNISHVISDLRTAKRYLNAITFTMPLIKNEVNYCDLLLLEFIRIFEINIYNELPKYETELTSFDSDFISSSDYLRKEKFKIFNNLRQIIDTQCENERKTLIENILGNLFPLFGAYIANPTNPTYITNEYKKNYERDLRITTTTHFKKYFSLRLSSNEVPKTLIDNFIQLLNNEQMTTCDGIIDILKHYQKNRNFMNTLDKLILYEMNISLEGKKKLSKAIIGMSSEFNNEISGFWKSEEKSAINLLLLCINSQDLQEFEKLFRDSVVNAKSLSFSVQVFSKVFTSKNQDFPEVKNKDLILDEIKKRIHKELITDKNDVFKLYPNSFSTIISLWKSEEYINEREIANEYIYGLLRENYLAIPFLLSQYCWRTMDGKLSDLDYQKFKNEFDTKIIYQIIEESRINYNDETKKFLINEFKGFYLEDVKSPSNTGILTSNTQ